MNQPGAAVVLLLAWTNQATVWTDEAGLPDVVGLDTIELPELPELPDPRLRLYDPDGQAIEPRPEGIPGRMSSGMIRPDIPGIESALEWYCMRCRNVVDRPATIKSGSPCCGAGIGARKLGGEATPFEAIDRKRAA